MARTGRITHFGLPNHIEEIEPFALGMDFVKVEDRTVEWWRLLKDYYPNPNLSKIIIIDTHTEASNAMAKMSRKKIAKTMKAKLVKVTKPKKLPPGKYQGIVVNLDTGSSNPTFEIVSRRSWPTAMKIITQNSMSCTDDAPKQLKTKVQMLDRIKELEAHIDNNNRRHALETATMRLDFATKESGIFQRFAEGLLEAHISGLKEGSLPRRS